MPFTIGPLIFVSVFSTFGFLHGAPQENGHSSAPNIFGVLTLLRDNAIRKLILLTPDQISNIEAIENQSAELSKQGDKSQLPNLLETLERKAHQVLTDVQAKKLLRIRKLSYFEMPYFKLMRDRSVQDDLRLTTMQRQMLDTLYTEWLSFCEEKIGVDRLDNAVIGELNRELMELHQARESQTRNGFVDSLTDEQRIREEELALQKAVSIRGGHVFGMANVQTALNFDPTMQEFVDEVVRAQLELRGVDRVKGMVRAYEQILEKLSSTQRKRWEEMLGPPAPFKSWLNVLRRKEAVEKE